MPGSKPGHLGYSRCLFENQLKGSDEKDSLALRRSDAFASGKKEK